MKKTLLLWALLLCVLSLAACTMMMQHACLDANGDTYCDTCSAYVAPAACASHIDSNADGLCDRVGCGAKVLKDMGELIEFGGISGVVKKKYSGKPYTIEVENAPSGAKITYDISNTQINAGEYVITATVKAEGYKDATFTAKLIIAPKEITINWGEFAESYSANGKAPDLPYTLNGVLEGDEVEVEFDFGKYDFIEIGTVTVKAVSKNSNYEIKTNKAQVVMSENHHKITFDTGVEGVTVSEKSILNGEKLDNPRAITKKGHEFLGWYNGDAKWNFDSPVTEPMTLTAKWQPIEYKINYVLNGGINNSDNPETYTVLSGATIAAPTREGRVFLGWYTDQAFSTLLSGIKAGSTVEDISLFARWSDDGYNEIKNAENLTEPLKSSNYLGAGSFKYIFSADISDFAEDGAIYIGRGKEDLGGSYIKIVHGTIEVHTKNAEGKEILETTTHLRSLEGYVVIELTVNNGNTTITLRTDDGETNATVKSFVGKVGEIFVSAENAKLENASLAWYTYAYDEPVWILGESGVAYDGEKCWVKNLLDSGFLSALVLSADGFDSTLVLEYFEALLESYAPKYAVWVFPTENGEEYNANLASFLRLCEENNITPILTTHLEAGSEEKNAAVVSSGKRYIDFASLALYNGDNGIYGNSGYTEHGAAVLYAKVLVDFPEIIVPTLGGEVVASVPSGQEKTTVSHKEASAEVLNAEAAPYVPGDEDCRLLIDEKNMVKDGKVMVFTAKIDGTLGQNQSIILAHGYRSTYAAWVRITSTHIKTTDMGANLPKKEDYIDKTTGVYDEEAHKAAIEAVYNKSTDSLHGLTIKNYLTVIMIADKDGIGNRIRIITDGGEYYGKWSGNPCNGNIEVIADGVTLYDAKAYWTCQNYSAPIWILGASYFSLGDPARWPSYMYADKLSDDILIIGRGGADTTQGLVQLENALQHGKPEYIIWGYGMNDGKDTDDTILQKTYDNHIKFLEICKANGIEPIFFSSVNCTDNYHSGKIDYVLNHRGDFANYEYRVIRLPHAVNGFEPGSEWYDGMLSEDGIHPTNLGARNFYLETVCTFPELMMGADSLTVRTETPVNVNAGATYKLENTPESVECDMAISMSADFDGRLNGKIIVGNGKGVNGGTWVEITKEKVSVYKTEQGKDVLLTETDNEIVMQELVMLRIIVRDNVANIAFVSSGDSDPGRKTLFSVEAPWSYAGEVFVSTDATTLSDVVLNFVSEK